MRQILQQHGFLGYSGDSSSLSPDFRGDYLFEKDNFYQNLLAATREKFSIHGTKRLALLEFTSVEQRILTINEIETKIHEDLLKWQDEYNAAQVSLRPGAKLEIPHPTKSPLWSNIKTQRC